MAATFSVAVLIKGIDRATAPIARVQAAINRVTRPLTDVQERIGKLSAAAGLPRLKEAASGVASAVGDMTSAMQSAFLRISAVAVGVAGATYAIVKSSASYGDEIVRVADRLGIGTDAIQKWLYAGRQADLENETLIDGLDTLSKKLGQAGLAWSGGGAKVRNALRLLGIESIKENDRLMSMEKVFPLVVDGLAKMDKGYRRAAIAQMLFGSAAEQVLALVDAGGAAGLLAAGSEAEGMGRIISPQGLATLVEADRVLKRLGEALGGLRDAVAVQLAPAITDIVNQISAWIATNRPQILGLVQLFAAQLPAAMEIARFAFEALRAVVTPMITVFQWLSETIGPVPTIILVLGAVLTAVLIPTVLATVAAFSVLSAALVGTPVGWVILAIVAVIAAITALVAAVAWLWTNWDKITGWLADAWTWMKTVVSDVVDAIRTRLSAAWSFISSWAKRIAAVVARWILDPWGALKDFFGGLWDWIEQRFAGAVEWIAGKVKWLVDLLPDWVKGALGIQVAAPAQLAPPIGREKLAQISGATTRFESRATVKVDFSNLPKGTRVTPTSNDGAELDLSLGYSNLTP